MSPEAIAWLLSWAVFYTGYSMPDQLPIIEFVPPSFFVQRICNNVDTVEFPCTVRAMYDDNMDGIIFIDEIYEDGSDFEVVKGFVKSIIVHEMVHYLQDLSGDWKDIDSWQEDIRCQEREFRQREAYMAQDKYMLDVYNKRRLMRRRFQPCGEY